MPRDGGGRVCPARAQGAFLGATRATPGPGKTAAQSHIPRQPRPGCCVELNCNLDSEGAHAFLNLIQSNRLPEKPTSPP